MYKPLHISSSQFFIYPLLQLLHILYHHHHHPIVLTSTVLSDSIRFLLRHRHRRNLLIPSLSLKLRFRKAVSMRRRWRKVLKHSERLIALPTRNRCLKSWENKSNVGLRNWRRRRFITMLFNLMLERQRKLSEEQRNLVQQQSQNKAQMLRYEDELARKRMQGDFPGVIEEYLEYGVMKCIAFNHRGTLLAAGCSDGSCVIWDFMTRGVATVLKDKTDNEAQRHHNAELVRMQEQSSIRKEQARRATEEQIQAQQRQTEKERDEIEG